MTVSVTILAHDEERRIGACLASLLAEPGDFPIHVVVNGTRDRTAAIARGHGPRVAVHDYPLAGKARSWNRFVLDELPAFADTQVFVDGDAEIAPGSIAALARCLAEDREANVAAAMPMNGRNAAAYRAQMQAGHGLFGDLYAVRGSFLARMRERGVRLPDDLIGDDGLIGALAKTDLENEDHWRDDRVAVCAGAGFLCAPVSPLDPSTWRMQYRRLISYSIRHYQNRIVSGIMRGPGPAALPAELASLYPEHLPGFRPRGAPSAWWFDRQALRRMRAAARSR